MICRLHGVVNTLRKPDGSKLSFPGCFKCQSLTEGVEGVPVLERTSLYKELAGLELGLLGNKVRSMPRVDFTLAQMVVMGVPDLR